MELTVHIVHIHSHTFILVLQSFYRRIIHPCLHWTRPGERSLKSTPNNSAEVNWNVFLGVSVLFLVWWNYMKIKPSTKRSLTRPSRLLTATPRNLELSIGRGQSNLSIMLPCWRGYVATQLRGFTVPYLSSRVARWLLGYLAAFGVDGYSTVKPVFCFA